MKPIVITTVVIAVLLLIFGCAPQKTQEQIRLEAEADTMLESGEQLYLAHNLWYEKEDKIEAINFKNLPMRIPVGTAVDGVLITFDQGYKAYCIKFKVAGQRRVFELMMNGRYQSNEQSRLSIKELYGRTFTNMTLDELTQGLKPEEIDNIKRGTIQQGMSKKAVLMSWGYPPLHGTLNIDEDQWAYWKKRSQREFVDFDEYGKVFYSTWYGKGGNFVDVIE